MYTHNLQLSPSGGTTILTRLVVYLCILSRKPAMGVRFPHNHIKLIYQIDNLQALAAMGHWEAAVAKARCGEGLAAGPLGRSPEFQMLLDELAVSAAAAAAGSSAGFDGRRLEVRGRYISAQISIASCCPYFLFEIDHRSERCFT